MPQRRDDGGGLPPSLKSKIDSLSADQVRELIPQLLAMGGAARMMEEARGPRPSRLHPPRDEVLTYRVRVDLLGAKPPIWRRVELASDMTLDVLHRVLQVVMGWTDSHLHGFSSGGDLYDRDAERYLTEYELSEGEEGVPETDVRLDQVLRDVGDRLHYEYDFGDSWTHRIKLEAVSPREEGAAVAHCLTGRRACPPEDVGGIPGYTDLLEGLAGVVPVDEDFEDRLTWLGPDFDPDHFSVDEVNQCLRTALIGFAGFGGSVPPALASMLSRAGHSGRPLLEELVVRARLDDDTPVGADVADRMVAPFAWFLRRLGTDGVKLTAAGYLPPAVVKEVVAELDLRREWIGTSNREDSMYPALEFRESTQVLGLVKKRSGRLSLTAVGRRLTDDPLPLWQHIASRLPLAPDDAARDAGIVALLLVAAEEPFGWKSEDAIAAVLASLGWRYGPNPVSSSHAFELARPTWNVLRRMGAVVDRHGHSETDVATPEGRLLARAALRSM